MFEPSSQPTTTTTPSPSAPAPSSAPAPQSTPAPSPAPSQNAAPKSDAPKPTGIDRLKQKAREFDPAKATPASPTPGEPPKAAPAGDAVIPAADTDAGKPAEAPKARDWKFKAFGKEHEVPEWMRGMAQTEEQAKELKQLHERALGTEAYRQRSEQSETQLKKVMPEYQKLEASRTELVNHFRRGDLDAFFNTLGVAEEKVLQWAVKKAELYQMPPEQRKVHEDRAAADRRAYQLEQELTSTRSQQANDSASQMQQSLHLELAKPEVAEIAKFVNESSRKPDTFIREVIEAGESHWYRTKQVLTPAQAVQAVMARYAGFRSAPQPQAGAGAEDPGTPGQPAAQPGLIPPAPAPGAKPQAFATKPASGQQAPTLPNVAAKTGSPVGSPKARSIDDLKRIRKERFGA
jgi:hypothetical protein